MTRKKSTVQQSRLWCLAKSAIQIAVLAYVGLVLILYFFQNRFFYFPSAELQMTPSQLSLRYEEVALVTEDETVLSGWYLPVKDPKAPVVLFCHGRTGNISNRLPALDRFHQLGLAVLIFDYRGYGKSEGNPSEEGMYQDARAVWHYLREVRHISADQIIIFGRSLGAAVAAELAVGRHPRALILESGFTSIGDLAGESYPYLPVRLLSRYDYPTEAYVKKIEAPVLIIHSLEDEIIPYAHAKRLFAAAPDPKKLVTITGRHNDRAGPKYIQGLRDFLTEHADYTPPPPPTPMPR